MRRYTEGGTQNMQSSNNGTGFNIGIGAFVALLGAILLPVALAGLFGQEFSGISWLFIALLFSSVLMLYGGVVMIISAIQEQKKHAEIRKLSDSGKIGDAFADTIASWEIDPDTWNAFDKNERKYRKSDNLYYFIAFAVAGTILLMWVRNGTFFVAAGISLAMSGVIVWIRHSLSLKKLKVARGEKLFVLITKSMLILNGEHYALRSDTRRIKNMQLLTGETPVILEFTIAWRTRNGETFDELRIPVPEQNIPDAEKVMQAFNHVISGL